MAPSIPAEAIKEILFGGAFGFCSGLVVKKLSLPALAGVASVAFFMFRAAIFDARMSAPWSPLKIDDASFTADLKRKARREGLSENKRVDAFFKENFFVFAGFGGGLLTSNVV